MSAERLEPRSMLAVVLPSGVTGPGGLENMLGAPLVLSAGTALGVNAVSIVLTDMNVGVNPFVVAKVTAPDSSGVAVTKQYYNYASSISFLGLTSDIANGQDNQITLESPYGVDLAGDTTGSGSALMWNGTANFTLSKYVVPPSVSVTLNAADSLIVRTGAGPSTIGGKFDSPTAAPGLPNASIEFQSNATVKVDGANFYNGVDTYDLKITGVPGASVAVIDLQGRIDVENDLTLTDTNTIDITQPITAGGTVTVNTISGGIAGAIKVSQTISADDGITIGSTQNLDVNADLVTKNAAIALSAVRAVTIDADLTATSGITVNGTTGITLLPTADLLTAGGVINFGSTTGAITAAGTVTSLLGSVVMDASGAITSSAQVFAGDATGVTLTSTLATVDTSGTITAPAGNVGIDANLDAIVSGAIAAPVGSVDVTAIRDVKTSAGIAALSSIAVSTVRDIEIGGAISVTGNTGGSGQIDIKTASGNIRVLPLSPITVVDGDVVIDAADGRVDIESYVGAFVGSGVDNTIDILAATGITLSNAVDLGAKIESFSPDGKITIRSDANLVLVDSPLWCSGHSIDPVAILVESTNGAVDVRDDVKAVTGLQLLANTTLAIGGVAAPITLESQTATIDATSDTSTVTLNSNLAFSLPGAGASLALTAATLVTVPIPVTAGGGISVTSPNGFSVQSVLTTNNAGITITATAGGVSSVLPAASLFANGDIALSGATGVSVDQSISSATGGVELVSGGGAVVISPTTLLAAPDAGGGTIDIDSALTPTILIPLLAGNDITIAAGPAFVSTHDFTSITGGIDISVTGPLLDVSDSTLIALGAGGNIALSAPAGLLIVDFTTIFANPVFGNLTLIDGLGFMPIGPLTIGGTLTIATGGAWTPPAGDDVTSLNGGIDITVDAILDASQIFLKAPNGSISLTSKTSDVIVGAAPNLLTVDPVTGSITLDAGGTVSFDQPLTAGGSITLDSVGTLEIGYPLTAGAAISLAATGATSVIRDKGTKGPTITSTITAADLSATFSGIGALEFVDKAGLNDVDNLSVTLPSGTGVSFVDVDDLTVTGLTTGGPVDLNAVSGFLAVTGAIGSTPPFVTTVALAAASDITVGGAITALGAVTATSAGGKIDIGGAITSTTDAVTLLATGGIAGVTVGGAIAAAGMVAATAPAGPIAITGNIASTTEGVDITAAGAITLGGTSIVAGGALGVVSKDVVVTSVAGAITSSADVTAVLGAIRMTTANTLQFTGGSLVTGLAYTSGPPVAGLVSLQGDLGIDVTSNPVVKCGRLELGSGGGGPVSLTSASNMVTTLEAKVGGNLTFSQVLVPLTIDDPDSPLRSIQVQSTAGSVSLSSTAGLRIVDGLAYNTTLSLVGRTTGNDPGVQFVPTDAGDNPSPPNLPHPFAFAGTLRDMLEYVNDNTAITGALPGTTNTPMRVQFDEPLSPIALGGTIALNGPAPLPFIAKAITFDGTLPPVPGGLGGIVGIDGTGVVGNGLTFEAGSSGSTLKNTAIHGFAAGAGVQLLSADNLLHDLGIGIDRDGLAAGNDIGIDVSGAGADRNTIGVLTAGSGQSGNVIGNNLKSGIQIRAGADYTRIQGNAIGIDYGFNPMPNAGDGIAVEASLGTVIGSDTVGLGNLIANSGGSGINVLDVSGNLTSYGVQVIGNTITDNGQIGVRIAGGSRNLVGGATLNAGNTIERNLDGIRLVPSLTSWPNENVVIGNAVADNVRYGIRVWKGFFNRISGNTVADNGVSGIHLFETVASRTAPSNRVVGNTVTGNGATAADGGIVVENSSGQVIGVTNKGVISGNDASANLGGGIVVKGVSARSNQLVGNTASTNTFNGIFVQNALATTLQGNVASGNTVAGIAVEDVIATRAADGTAIVSNVTSGNGVGISIAGGRFNRVGGTLTSEGNQISGNVGHGIVIQRSGATGLRATSTVIRNNFVGTAAGNGGFGIVIDGASDTTIDHGNLVTSNAGGGISVADGGSTTVGSALAGRGNSIIKNGNPIALTGDGVRIVEPAVAPKLTTDVRVIGNLIEDNGRYGVSVVGARTNTVVVGRQPSIARPNGTENTIKGNGAGKLGVLVDAAKSVAVIGNNIVVDAADPTSKPIEVKNLTPVPPVPVITSAVPAAPGKIPQMDIRGQLTATAGASFYVDIYSVDTNSDQVWIGRVLVRCRADGVGAFRMIIRGSFAGQKIVATSTAAASFSLVGSTSEFSS